MSITYADKPWLKNYEEGVAKTITLPDKTIIDMFDESVKKHPDHVALFFKGTKITFREYKEQTDGYYLTVYRTYLKII